MTKSSETGDLSVDLGLAFDASPNPYVLIRPDLRIAGMNQAYLDTTHTRRDELIGQPVFGAFDSGPSGDAPENVRQVRDSMLKAISTGKRDHLAVVRFAIPRTLDDGSRLFEDRLWSATHTPILDAEGSVAFILQHTTDITEIEQLRQTGVTDDQTPRSISALDAIIGGDVLRRARLVQEDNRRLETERNRLVEVFMQSPGFTCVLTGPDHVFQMHNQAYAQVIGRDDVTGKSVREAVPEVVDQGFIELLDSVYQTGEPYEGREIRMGVQRTPGAPLVDAYLNFIYQPIRDATGTVVGIFVQGHDVTENVMATQRQKLMIDELNHRVKNTLATVQSIAMQTARSHDDPRSFAQGFQARLMALSHTHDLLTRSHWEGADLRDILTHETEAHGLQRISLNGPPVPLAPAAALSLGMIFHELATNAAKYGALSAGEGRVMVDWSLANQADRQLKIEWRETGGPSVEQPQRRGFGSRLVERNVRHDLAGEVKLGYPSSGFHAEISIPLDRDQP
ncbi:hypothetical protein BH10PSE2_BH10PSE2_25220 [soil metagenome]